MGRRLRSWLTGLLAGLFVLAMLPTPHMHAKAMLERAAVVLAQAAPVGDAPDLHAGHAPDHPAHGGAHAGTRGGAHDGLPHPHMPSCFACVVMASPGLASSGFLVAGRVALAVPAALDPPAAAPRRHIAWTPQSARAPPAGSIV